MKSNVRKGMKVIELKLSESETVKEYGKEVKCEVESYGIKVEQEMLKGELNRRLMEGNEKKEKILIISEKDAENQTIQVRGERGPILTIPLSRLDRILELLDIEC